MSEKRKPTLQLIAIVFGKRYRVDLFQARLWPKKFRRRDEKQYRCRVNGKWVHGSSTFTVSGVMRQLRALIVARIKKGPRWKAPTQNPV